MKALNPEAAFCVASARRDIRLMDAFAKGIEIFIKSLDQPTSPAPSVSGPNRREVSSRLTDASRSNASGLDSPLPRTAQIIRLECTNPKPGDGTAHARADAEEPGRHTPAPLSDKREADHE